MDTNVRRGKISLAPIAHAYAPKQRPGSSSLTRLEPFGNHATTATGTLGTSGRQPLRVASGDSDGQGVAPGVGSVKTLASTTTAVNLPSTQRLTPGKLQFESLSRATSAANLVPPKTSAAGKKLILGVIITFAVGALVAAVTLGLLMSGKIEKLRARYIDDRCVLLE